MFFHSSIRQYIRTGIFLIQSKLQSISRALTKCSFRGMCLQIILTLRHWHLI
ncbi:hypothetical protein MtrunA17_Chr2g0296361 [Medicago truncatula]|uniref:Uncharacterized protein n=1 Tax=Medicago truncatula TaxID=3880 RepID=A0A396J9J0_MEDTR|nr:hypothetical protein MtrunA17_Chr2g0296361 [Medicago truncatula]